MRGDFTRQTFDRSKHYRGVLMQQGRVQVDADWNEAQAIHAYTHDTVTRDVVGIAGAPRVDPGFGISVQAGTVQIGRGHFVLDGILCENDADVAITAQPYLPGFTLPDAQGLYLAFLDVWQRHVSVLEDPSLRETALGGVDTTTRLQTVWQVRLLPVAEPPGGAQCGATFPEWDQMLSREVIGASNGGRMSAQAEPVSDTSASPCSLPESAGFRRLENQLYRVEIHQGGTRSEARFKWSRDNGSIASAVEAFSGSEVTVDDIGRDSTRQFARGQWVEIADDALDLRRQRGELLRVDEVFHATNVVRLTGTLPTLDLGRHPTLRRWEQSNGTATSDGVPMTDDWIPLEDGVQVRFSEGRYRTGDFWVIPARTANRVDSGTIEWPDDGGTPRAKLPDGVRHHFARLAILRRSAGGFQLLDNGDCRTVFPPLTGLEARDVRFDNTVCTLDGARTVQQALDQLCQRRPGTCTVSLFPGADIAAAFARLTAGQSAQVCFAAGTYNLPAAIVVTGLGDLTLSGCGAATRFVVNSEAAFVFDACQSVAVRQCAVQGTRSEPGTGDGLNGALTFVGCGAVSVENVQLQCASGPVRAAACLTIRQAPALVDNTPPGLVRIRHCDLTIGHHQSGIVLVNVARADVHDNALRAGGAHEPESWLHHPDYRALYLMHFISRAVLGNLDITGTNAQVLFNGHRVAFRTDPTLTGPPTNNVWQQYVNAVSPQGMTSPAVLHRFIEGAMKRMVTTGELPPGMPLSVRTVRQALVAQDRVAASQGIVAGGVRASDVRIVGNTIEDAIQGIHVGVSRQTTVPTTADRADYVHIASNTVRLRIASTAVRERHGIFVGNVNSVAVRDNYVVATRAQKTASLRLEGIRLFGQVDRRVIVQANHMVGATVGIRFDALASGFARPNWLITDNLAVQSSLVVDVPDPNVRGRVRGLAENFS